MAGSSDNANDLAMYDNLLNVDATCKQVGRDQHPRVAAAEVAHDVLAFLTTANEPNNKQH